MPPYTSPLQGRAAAFKPPATPLTLSAQRAPWEQRADVNSYEEGAILGGGLLAHPVRRRRAEAPLEAALGRIWGSFAGNYTSEKGFLTAFTTPVSQEQKFSLCFY